MTAIADDVSKEAMSPPRVELDGRAVGCASSIVRPATNCAFAPPVSLDPGRDNQPLTRSDTLDKDKARVTSRIDKWRARNAFYHRRKLEHLRFLIPAGASVLAIGSEDGEWLAGLRPSRGVGVALDEPTKLLAESRHPEFEHLSVVDGVRRLRGPFDFVVINDVAGELDDLYVTLRDVAPLCDAATRVVVVQHNYLWRPILRWAQLLGLKKPERRQNWLSVGDLRTFLHAAGFEAVDVRAKLFCPARLLGLGNVVNFLCGVAPFLDKLASTQIVVARRASESAAPKTKTASIVLTVRDERDNIEPMLRAIPDLGSSTEILFVEGHSNDGTREEIERVIAAHPERRVRLVVQDGVGQGDAIRKGFGEATGDVIILLEADQTTPAEDVRKVFDVLASGRAEFVNGSRFVYPRDPGSMPAVNVAGNWMFAAWFTWFLRQRTSDVLCGLKGVERRLCRRVLNHWGFLGLFDPFGDFELAFGAARFGLKICEVPTRYGCRRYGRPKTRAFRHGWMLLRMALRATRVFKCR